MLGTSLQDDPYNLNCALGSGTPYPTLQGIQAEESYSYNGQRYQSIELHRGGYLEFCSSRFTHSAPEGLSIIAIRVAVFSENFASLVARVYSHLQAQGPLAFGCTLLRIQEHKLFKGRNYLEPYSNAAWAGGFLDLGYRVTYDFASDRATITRSANDRLWNAFRFGRYQLFQAERSRLSQDARAVLSDLKYLTSLALRDGSIGE